MDHVPTGPAGVPSSNFNWSDDQFWHTSFNFWSICFKCSGFFSLNVMAEPNFRCMMILILYALFICRITQFIVINCVIWMKTGQILNIFFCYLVIKVYLLYRTKKCNQANKWVSSLKLFRLELAGVFLGSEFSSMF